MKSTFQIEKPSKIECTLTLTMNLKDWETLQGQLDHYWPASVLASQINNLVKRMGQVLELEDGEADA